METGVQLKMSTSKASEEMKEDIRDYHVKITFLAFKVEEFQWFMTNGHNNSHRHGF